MMLNKPKFWDKKINFISIFLFPISLLYLSIIFLKKKISKIEIFNVRVICVGNIYLGGTGKTPTSIFLAKEIEDIGKKVTILRKYYKSHEDEHDLIRENFKNLILCKNREIGLRNAEKSGFDIVILDDGLQDYKIKKDIKIVCFNNNQLIGNGLVLPAGPLRENLSALNDANIVIINGVKNLSFEEKILKINKRIKFFYSLYLPTNLSEFRNKKLLALAGIGNPENFFKLLEKNNLHIEKKIIFPDHHKFSKKEVEKIVNEADRENLQIIVTEKDYYKLKKFKLDKIRYLKIILKIDNQGELINMIKEIL